MNISYTTLFCTLMLKTIRSQTEKPRLVHLWVLNFMSVQQQCGGAKVIGFKP